MGMFGGALAANRGAATYVIKAAASGAASFPAPRRPRRRRPAGRCQSICGRFEARSLAIRE
eukprot:12934308-Prorocentrum_lima.AAC.1